MIELAQHIEVLLLENDCVIVPNLGGFVAHYASSIRLDADNLFLPPTRSIGFNPQLQINDGILVQSYMNLYDINFPDASRRIEKEVDELIITLHKEGKVELANVGEIRYTINETFEFVPYDNKITTPYLYGLDSFEMRELIALQLINERTLTPAMLNEKRSYEIKVNRSFLRHSTAIVAAIALFFILSTPIENTYIETGNYAQLLPMELFEKIKNRSVTTTSIVSNYPMTEAHKTEALQIKPVSAKTVKVAKASTKETKVPTTQVAALVVQTGNFHIIVAGGVSLKNAEALVVTLKSQGYANARVLTNGEKMRVSIMSHDTNEEATKQMLQLRKNESYKNAWLLAK